MAEVVIYTTATCPYCMRARRLLERKGVSFQEIRVDLEPSRWQEMEERSRRNTVPQIFIGHRSIGGFDDLAELDFDGELDGLLGSSSQ
ncbi:MAG: glutaredoxin 3 [Proteobacteria bacterium]|nr:MAG: glutaredoxin 3 [Pseudomonadota bacterium]QKK10511.1 MAG: glutaredoxin 3 [Pseudomonadota bacterium]